MNHNGCLGVRFSALRQHCHSLYPCYAKALLAKALALSLAKLAMLCIGYGIGMGLV